MNQKNKSSSLQIHSKKNLNKFGSSDDYIFREINIFAKESFPSDKEYESLYESAKLNG